MAKKDQQQNDDAGFGLEDESTQQPIVDSANAEAIEAEVQRRVAEALAKREADKPTGVATSTTHERMLAEHNAGEEMAERIKQSLHRRNNPHKFIYQVEYWLRDRDAIEYDAAIADNKTPRILPLRTQFTSNKKMHDSGDIGDAWWRIVKHRGIGHFNNEVPNTRPARIAGTYVGENEYWVKPAKPTDAEVEHAATVKKRREADLAHFKKHSTLEAAPGNNGTVSNEIPVKVKA